MKTFKAAILGDFQIPYHDERAVDVAKQVVRDAEVDVLFINGDFLDLANFSKFPSMRTPVSRPRLTDFSSEIALGKQIFHEMVAEIGPKKVLFNDGNHEYRTFRSFAQTPSHELKQIGEYLMGLDINPISTPAMLGFSKKVSYADYPMGQWLHPDLPLNENVWVEHGNIVRDKAGYTAESLQNKRQCSVVINHVHRLSCNWKHTLGGRDFLMIENGHLSILGVPGLGDGLYQGPHHSVADYQNAQQGFHILTHDGTRWHPEQVTIKDGKAFYGGKSYKSRIIAGAKQPQLTR